MPKTKKFSLNRILGNSGAKKKIGEGNALPPSTSTVKPRYRKTASLPPDGAGDKKANVRFLQTLQTFDEDGVSAITPVAGMPGESPRRRSLLSLASPGPRFRPGPYAGDDDISAMTPASPLRGGPPPQAGGGDGEDSSGGLVVYEDDEEGSGGVAERSHQMLGTMKELDPKDEELATDISHKWRQGIKLRQTSQSWFTGTKYFQRMVDSSFDMIDVDKSGDVTLEELYSGLLLIHLKLAVYAGAPACRPASLAYVTEIFHLLDTDGSGALSKEEFAAVVKILYSQVFTRIIIQWGLTLMIVPVISQYTIKHVTLLYWAAHDFLKDMDDELDPLERLLGQLWAWSEAWCLLLTPHWLEEVGALLRAGLRAVPWASMPPVFLTLAQTSVALPFVLNHVEDFFRRAAHSDVRRQTFVGSRHHERHRGKLKER